MDKGVSFKKYLNTSPDGFLSSLYLWFPRVGFWYIPTSLLFQFLTTSSYIFYSALLNREIWNCFLTDLSSFTELSGGFWHPVNNKLWLKLMNHLFDQNMCPIPIFWTWPLTSGQGIYSEISCFSLEIRGFIHFWLYVFILFALQIKIRCILWFYWFSSSIKQFSPLWHKNLIKHAPSIVSKEAQVQTESCY